MHAAVAGAALLLAVAAPRPGLAETLTNEAIVELTRAGLSADAIVAKIGVSSTAFRLATVDLIALKRAKVADAVMIAMLRAGAPGSSVATVAAVAPPGSPAKRAEGSAPATAPAGSPPPPAADDADAPPTGVYLVTTRGLTSLDPIATTATRNRNLLGYALTGGLAPVRLAAVVPGVAARVRTASARPEFHVMLAGAPASGPLADGPGAFALVRLAVRDASREAPVGEYHMRGAALGPPDHARLPVTHAALAPGEWRIAPAEDLAPGEYAFVLARSGRTGMGLRNAAIAARVFDFAVIAPAAETAAR